MGGRRLSPPRAAARRSARAASTASWSRVARMSTTRGPVRVTAAVVAASTGSATVASCAAEAVSAKDGHRHHGNAGIAHAGDAEGVRLPYQEYLQADPTGEAARRILCRIPPGARAEFSYVGEHVRDDLADERGYLVWTEIPLVNSITDSAGFRANAAQQMRESRELFSSTAGRAVFPRLPTVGGAT